MQRHVNSAVYCRFCAEEKSCTDIMPLSSQEDRKSLDEKLSVIGLSWVDFTDKLLPENVCIPCYGLLDMSNEFVERVRRSHAVLSEILCVNETEVKEEFDVEEKIQDDCIPMFEEALVEEDNCDSSAETDKISSTVESEEIKANTKDTPLPQVAPEKQTWSTYPWQCATCGSNEGSLTALRKHCCSEHLKCFAFKCADCDEDAEDFDEFVRHVRGHRKMLRKYCEYCNIEITDRSHPNTHIIDSSCTFCGDTFTNQDVLNKHLKLYAATPTGLLAFNMEIMELNETDINSWKDYPSICQFCNLRMMDKDVLKEHCIKVHGQCFGNQCIDCYANMNSFKRFVEHVRQHRPRLRNVCPYCNLVIADEDLNHIQKHTAAYSCNFCGEIFEEKQQLTNHENIKLPKLKDTICDTCGLVLKNPANLKQHLKKHGRKRDYTCDRCGKTFYTKTNLDNHNKTHDDNKETCKICHKTFLNLNRLRSHVQTHNLVLPSYQCDHCKRYFVSKVKLIRHIVVHMEELKRWPFKCKYCTKTFRFKTIVKTHENQHTGAKPYSCNDCFRVFVNWSNCNKHMKRKHGTTLAKNVMTPHGKLAINPETGKPKTLMIDNDVKEWTERLLKAGKQQA